MPNPTPSLMGPDSNPSFGMNGWQVEAYPPNACIYGTNPHPPWAVRIICSSGVSGNLAHLNETGIVAVRNQFTSYQTAAKLAEIKVRDPYRQPSYLVTAGGCWMDCLPEDGPTQIAALCSIFQTVANLTTKW